MPTERIDKPEFIPCDSIDHKPPAHRVFKPGTYKHTCSKCGKVTIFTVKAITV
jgi:hypothetical protein